MSKRRTTSIGDGIGADQRAQWRKALAASKRQQRQQRGRQPVARVQQIRPGMIRRAQPRGAGPRRTGHLP